MNDNDDTIRREAPTRRDYVKYGGTVVGGGLLAGCTGDGPESDDSTSNESSSEESDAADDERYTVDLSPVGKVEFDAPPKRVVAFDRQWIHIAYELGHGDAVVGAARPDSLWFTLHETLPGVSIDLDGIESFYGDQIDKEVLYEIDPDLIAVDPLRAPTLEGLDESDIEELERNVAPFFANRYSWTEGYDGDETYTYYTLFDLYEKFGEAFEAQDRVAALREVDEDLTETIHSDLPPEEERPTVMQVGYYDGEFYTYDIEDGGIHTRHYREVGARSAIRETYGDDVPFEFGTAVDFETLLEIDPDVLIQASSLFYGDVEGVSHEDTVEEVSEHEVGSELTAIQNDAYYPGGTPYAGPVAYLFYSELTAKYLYPETFGEFPGLGEIPEEEQLFDRQRVADIINGDI
ncbi:ABC transporter substrate-binding protein [Halorubrum sp. AD140]|uniref:ABC transporter substrate-binding protein n=1 Tax=Halorubrum sp. AD140 TaxID=3050073 RepID=UPI002ACD1D4A|nr:ABC transporter substrate-binding protein [Halorubrum sp. AD140]MDZ5812753.1 ABC transporter substrate-binding protein [Halorubrum sp. AD140]